MYQYLIIKPPDLESIYQHIIRAYANLMSKRVFDKQLAPRIEIMS